MVIETELRKTTDVKKNKKTNKKVDYQTNICKEKNK